MNFTKIGSEHGPGILYKIHSHSLVDISKYDTKGYNQQELIIVPKTKFKVIDIKKSGDKDGNKFKPISVELKEL